jgi:LPXTG-motif cell wall-anchored protein
MTSKGAGLLAIVVAAAVLWAIPTASVGKVSLGEALRQVGANVGSTVDSTVAKTEEELRKARERAKAALLKAQQQGTSAQRATATDPATQPPAHGSDPHGQGGVAVVDTNPSSERPLANDPTGAASGEDAIVGRAGGAKVNGAYRGHITILSLLGQELAGVDTNPGETKNGPLQAVQTGILDPLCMSTSNQVCLSVLTANSTTTATKSDNDFAIARASVLGLGVGAAESHGTISEDANCQAAVGSSRVANVSAPGGGAVAQVSDATTTSKSCRGAAPVVTNTSHVIGLGGVQVPLPAAGCANGTADTVTGIPAVLPIVCNADDVAGAQAVREALDVFVLQVGGTSLAKATTAASEALTVAPAETSATQCADNVDNDGDGLVDEDDPGCHTDGNANNPNSYNPADDNEANSSGGTGGSGNNNAECNDNRDNDGDGKVDADDPGCHEGNNINNPYNPDDDSEGSDGNGNGGNGGNGNAGAGNAPTGGQGANAGNLPFTGTDVVGLALAGLLMLAGGLLLRRREDSYTAY